MVLEIFKYGDTLKMSVFKKEEASSTLRHYSQCKVPFFHIDKLCQEVTLILNKADKNGVLEAELMKRLKKTSRLLWEQLFTRSVKERLKSMPVMDLILSIDEELINIPWELLYDGNNFFCLNFNLGRLVRTEVQSHDVQYRSFSGALKMLILANPTNDLSSAYSEGLNIRNQFDRKRNNVRIDFKSTNIDKLYIKKNFCDYDIVHFAGHCEHEEDNPQESGWVVSDGRFNVQDILSLSSANSFPSLIFSNACHSAKADSGLIETDYQRRNYNLACAFLFSGVRHYLGSIRRIEDNISLDFAREFYTQLLLGRSVGESVRLARFNLLKGHGAGSIPWAGYILYGDPNFIFFKPKASPLKPKAKINILRYRKRLLLSLAITAILGLAIFAIAWLPSMDPNSYILYLRTQKFYQKGDNVQVFDLSRRIIEKDPLFLAIYPLLGDTYQRQGDSQNALKYYFDYALYSERKHDSRNLASAYVKLGWFYAQAGEYSKAFAYYNKAIDLSVKIGDRLHEAEALRKLALWYLDKKEHNRALELLVKSSEINRERKYLAAYRYNLACDYFDMGLVFSDKNDLSAAKEFYQKSLAIFEKMKLRSELSDYYFNLGEIFMLEKEFHKALDFYTRGLEIDESLNNKMNLPSDYNMLGELYVDMDKSAQAEEHFNKAVLIASQLSNRVELASAYHNLGLLYKKKGKKNKTRDYLRQAQEIYREIDPEVYQEIKKVLLSLDEAY